MDVPIIGQQMQRMELTISQRKNGGSATFTGRVEGIGKVEITSDAGPKGTRDILRGVADWIEEHQVEKSSPAD